jgi:hypothetical protein
MTIWDFGDTSGRFLEALILARQMIQPHPAMTNAENRIRRFLNSLFDSTGLVYNFSSGDHPKSNPNTLGTFNPLFPKGNYFGVLATTGLGPINFIDFHPKVEGTFPHNVTASFDWIIQWRQSLQDGVYAVPGFLIRPADGSRARFVGHRPGIEVRWQVNSHLWFQADYGIFYAGRFLKETQPGRNLNDWALWAGYKF